MTILIELILYLTPICAALAVSGIVADYILPRIRPLERWIDSLPAAQEESGQKNPVRLAPNG